MIPIIAGMETQGINVTPLLWGLAAGGGRLASTAPPPKNIPPKIYPPEKKTDSFFIHEEYSDYNHSPAEDR